MVLKRCLWRKVWKRFVFFDSRKSDYSVEKVNFPENSLLYINQAYLTVKKNTQKIYCDFFILGQPVKAVNPPEEISTYQLKEGDMKMVRPKYNPDLGEFLGLYEMVGFIVVRAFPKELFFDYGYHREKYEVLYLHYRRRIPNSFSGTISNRHRTMIESEEVDDEKSNIYFFLPSITDRSEEINNHLNNVSISAIDISKQ